MPWQRDTPWRQGHVLKDDDAKRLGLAEGEGTVAVVVAHDCDLAQLPAREPAVEVIVGRWRDKPDGTFTHSKSSRRLHLQFSAGAQAATIELDATAKRQVLKDELGGALPRSDIQLTSEGQTILQCWLAARYRRTAFPDLFDQRLEQSGVVAKLKKILGGTQQAVAAIYFDVDQGRDLAKESDDDVYTLGIYLLYYTGEDPETAAASSAKVKAAIESAFNAAFFKENRWKGIELQFCEIISDETLTYRQSTLLRKWNLDYLSLMEELPLVTD